MQPNLFVFLIMFILVSFGFISVFYYVIDLRFKHLESPTERITPAKRRSMPAAEKRAPKRMSEETAAALEKHMNSLGPKF